MAYHVDCLYAAVAVLAGHGHIKQRLISAYENHIDKLNAEDLPLSAREAYAELDSRLHQVAPLNGEGPICASVRKMSVTEASACAESILELYRDVASQARAETEFLPLDSEDQVQVPPFLVKSV